MARFDVHLSTNSAAFHANGDSGDAPDHSATARELAQILRGLADDIDPAIRDMMPTTGGNLLRLRDHNGNRVGYATYNPTPTED